MSFAISINLRIFQNQSENLRTSSPALSVLCSLVFWSHVLSLEVDLASYFPVNIVWDLWVLDSQLKKVWDFWNLETNNRWRRIRTKFFFVLIWWNSMVNWNGFCLILLMEIRNKQKSEISIGERLIKKVLKAKNNMKKTKLMNENFFFVFIF